ncbi:preprotein translocase subunit TatC [Haloferula helveola]|uniref:Sec-independent protein translocase protein TatC n=1 Tax=Haloferula helveola TaxID=490095 RepID=A0ABN6H8X4_9BACT|nr:preprotein translocase subunit TatC [Haloferula helveola]
MYLLKKVFQLRDKANPDMEKPFLDHLEDLRATITRIILTLIISMIACFSLQGYLMDILRKPVEDVWLTHSQSMMPDGMEAGDWEQAKDILERAALLSSEERELLFSYFDDATRERVEAARLMRASLGLPDDKRDEFLKASAAGNESLAKLIEQLAEAGADPDSIGERDLMRMSSLNPTETFMLSMKLAFFAGVIVSFPFLLFFILQFVLPGLHNNERKILWPSMAIGFGLFLLGVLFAYFVVLPRALVFFYEWGLGMGVDNEWRIGAYIGFATQFTLLFGLSFELPVVIMALVKLGLLTYEMMSRTRSYAVLTIVVLAAMITPTSDLLTLSLMAVPMYILYEICIFLAWLDRRKQRREEAEEEAERMSRLLEDDGGEEHDGVDDHDPHAHDPYDHDPYDHDDPHAHDHLEHDFEPEADAPEDGEEEDIGDDLDDEPLYEEEERRDMDPPDTTPDEERRREDD